MWDEDQEICRVIWEGHPQQGRTRSSRAKVDSAWRAVPKAERIDYDAVVASMAAWRQSRDWLKDDGEFVPAAHRWIKDRKWTVTPARKGEDSLGKTLRSTDVSL